MKLPLVNPPVNHPSVIRPVLFSLVLTVRVSGYRRRYISNLMSFKAPRFSRLRENKMQEPSNLKSKDSCKFFNANWLVKMLIMNNDQNL